MEISHQSSESSYSPRENTGGGSRLPRLQEKEGGEMITLKRCKICGFFKTRKGWIDSLEIDSEFLESVYSTLETSLHPRTDFTVEPVICDKCQKHIDKESTK